MKKVYWHKKALNAFQIQTKTAALGRSRFLFIGFDAY
jgi:hypothetical protein